MTIRAIYGHFNAIMLKWVHADPTFVHGINNEEFQDLIHTTRCEVGNTTGVAWDATNFDSSNGPELVQAVDEYIIQLFAREIVA